MKTSKTIKVLLLLLFLSANKLIAQSYNKQHTYFDALEVARVYNQNKNNRYDDNSELERTFFNILSKYGITRTNIDSNIFLKGFKIEKIISNACCDPDQKNSKAFFEKSSEQTPLSSPMSWQASAINGMANFMAERFKQEILKVTIDQIFKQIKTQDNQVMVEAIFPKTYKQIEYLYESSSYYTSDLLLLRQIAQLDLEQFPRNIISNADIILPKMNLKPSAKDMLLLGNYIYKYSQQSIPLDQLLSKVANEVYSSDSTIYKVLNMADLFSQALLNSTSRDAVLDGTWVNPIVSLPATFGSSESVPVRFFYGLLYQQLISIPELKMYLVGNGEANIYTLASKIQYLCSFVNELNDVYKRIDTQSLHLKNPDEIILFLTEINQALVYFGKILKEVPEINMNFQLNNEVLEVSSKYIHMVDPIIKKEYDRLIPTLLVEFEEYIERDKVTLRTLSFLCQLTSIKSAEEMEKLFSAYTLPIGSASIKRNSSFNLSINSYVGFTGGWERATGAQGSQTRGNLGLSAPIGFSVTTFHGYFTPFISVIDLGSLVNVRLNNDTTIYSNLKVEHFFSPGIGLFFNHPKLPISAGIHCNYVPNYRTIKYEKAGAIIPESNQDVARFNFSVLVDIPLFTIYNNDKRRR